MALYTISPGDICIITMLGRLDGQRIMNTFHYKAQSITWVPDGPVEVQALMTKIRTNIWSGEWKDEVSEEYKLEEIRGQIIYPTRRVFESLVVNEFGTKTTTPLPSFNTACITRYGSIPGRGRSASLQIAGLVAAQVEGSVLNDASIIAIQGIADQLDVWLGDSVAEPNAWAPVNWTLPKAADFNVIRSGLCHREVRTEKRRVVGRGI